MMREKKTELYNKEIKERFLESIENEDARNLVLFTFYNTYATEKLKNKDLFEMNRAEVESVMYSLSPSTATSSYNNIIRIEGYITWAIKNGLRQSNISPLDGVRKFEWGKQFISSYKSRTYSREEVLEMCDEMYNYVDKAILLALFEGIKGKGFSEITNLRPEDISKSLDGYSVSLKDFDESTRVIPISDKLAELLYLANSSKEYFTNNGAPAVSEREAPMIYENSPYIFKKINRGVQGGKLDRNFISRKFSLYKDVFSIKFLKASHIEVSGMMHMINELRKRDGGFKIEHVHTMAEHYNTPKSYQSESRNYTVALNKVDTKEFERIYGYKVTD